MVTQGSFKCRTVARAGVAVAAALIALGASPNVSHTTAPDFAAACGAGDPYYVASCFLGMSRQSSSRIYDGSAASLVLFRNTPSDSPRYSLATFDELGTIWGLAYRSRDDSLYASSFHKRQLPFGPSGPDAIYRVDLSTGDVAHAIKVPNVGPDRHEQPIRDIDRNAGTWAGRTSLGDLDISETEDELAVVNLDDGQVYRFALPSGNLLGSFPHGATGQAWAEEARPFGLAYWDGALYHGVVRTAEGSQDPSDLDAYVYRSAPDGSGMRLVAEIDLDYRRGRMAMGFLGSERLELDWQPWDDKRSSQSRSNLYDIYPMPLLVDISFDLHGNMFLGLRDRLSDSLAHFISGLGRPAERTAIGVGDVLRGVRNADSWEFAPENEFFDDDVAWFGDESTLGGLAYTRGIDQLAVGAHLLGAPGRGASRVTAPGVYWFDPASGNKLQSESVCGPQGLRPYDGGLFEIRAAYADDEGPRPYESRAPGTIGDVEALCARQVATPASPTPTPSMTPPATPTTTATVLESATPRPSATAMPPPTVTPTATRVPGPAYLPLVLDEECDRALQRADIVLVMDASSSMAGEKLTDAKDAAISFVRLLDLEPQGDQAAVVSFDADAALAAPLSGNRWTVEAAIRGLTTRRGTHIDEGLRVALAELEGPRRIEVNAAVIVLLTDGIHTGEPEADLEVARDVRDSGMRLYTIGLGEDVDEAALIEMAGSPERYFFAPDSSHLARLYGQIAVEIDCPAEDFWGRR